MSIKLIKHPTKHWVAQIEGSLSSVVDELDSNEFWTITKTNDELSLVSEIEANSSFLKVEGPWTLFQVEGVLDFGLTGILNSLTKPMADVGISIFAISTYNTDYILVKSEVADRAAEVWVSSGFPVKTRLK